MQALTRLDLVSLLRSMDRPFVLTGANGGTVARLLAIVVDIFMEIDLLVVVIAGWEEQ